MSPGLTWAAAIAGAAEEASVAAAVMIAADDIDGDCGDDVRHQTRLQLP